MSSAEQDFFDKLEKEGIEISPEQREQINNKLSEIINYEPRIGVFGKTGVGKSSLCNALFGTDICEISDVEACTRDIQEVMLNMGNNGIKLIDVPGVGESTMRDEEYGKLYSKLLPELDLVLWLIKSDDRALASDENFYKNVVKPHIEEGKPFFFVLNQVDKIEPFREWDEVKHEPGPKQFKNIYRKVDDIAKFFDISTLKVIPVSANEKYNLTKLVDEFVRALPAEKKITVFRAVNEEFQSKATGEHVKKSFLEVVGDVVCTTIETVGNIVCTVIDKVGNAIEKAGDWIEEHLPFGGGGGGCYITTAVCQNNMKPDDCYELKTFRGFRDNWLIKQPDGKQLIKKYYLFAPKIVELINASEDKDYIYNEINKCYLQPCLKYIEKGKMEHCKELYSKMVRSLMCRYLLWV